MVKKAADYLLSAGKNLLLLAIELGLEQAQIPHDGLRLTKIAQSEAG
jgi:hypothetical protein